MRRRAPALVRRTTIPTCRAPRRAVRRVRRLGRPVRDGHAPDDRRGHADRLADRPATRRSPTCIARLVRRRSGDRPARRDRRRGVDRARHGDIIYVGSRSEDRVQTFTVGRPVNGAPPYLLAGNYFFLERRRRATAAARPTRAAWRSRRPATGSTSSTAGRRACRSSTRRSARRASRRTHGIGADRHLPPGVDARRSMDTGDGERAYVSCFQDGQLYVIDPRGIATVEDIVLVGRGPYSVVAAPRARRSTSPTSSRTRSP